MECKGKNDFLGPRNSKTDEERGDGRRLGNVLTLKILTVNCPTRYFIS